MPPEQLDGVMTSKVDIWAFGCVLLELITGKEPYSDMVNEFQISRKMFQGITPLKYALALKGEETAILDKEEMKEIKDLLIVCLKLDHRLRPKASEILKMNLFNDVE